MPPFGHVEGKVHAGEAAVAVVDGGGRRAIGEIEVGHVGADDAARSVHIEGACAYALRLAPAQQPDDVELVRPLAVGDAAALLLIELVGPARAIDPVGVAPGIDHAYTAQPAFVDDAPHGVYGHVVAV